MDTNDLQRRLIAVDRNPFESPVATTKATGRPSS